MLLGASHKSPQLSRIPQAEEDRPESNRKSLGHGIGQFTAVMGDQVSGRLVERRVQTEVGLHHQFLEQAGSSIHLPGDRRVR
jgi:hypothetical protein